MINNRTDAWNADVNLLILWERCKYSNSPRSIYQYPDMAPRLSGQTSIFGIVFFVSKSLLGIERQKAAFSDRALKIVSCQSLCQCPFTNYEASCAWSGCENHVNNWCKSRKSTCLSRTSMTNWYVLVSSSDGLLSVLRQLVSTSLMSLTELMSVGWCLLSTLRINE